MSRKDKALSRLLSLLESYSYPPGGRLPPERELAIQLGLSRSGLREGLDVLEAQGKIWRGVGRGTFVGRPAAASAHLSVVTARTSPMEILEFRLLFEPMLARLAALRATEADLREMERLLQKGEETRNDGKIWDLWDSRLHRMVAEATHNNLLLSVFDAFNAVRKQATWGRLREAILREDRREEYCRQHCEFVAAIAMRDAARAETAMLEHIEGLRDILLGTQAEREASFATG
jgi:DNA-binding FadR family transcriptional regulator